MADLPVVFDLIEAITSRGLRNTRQRRTLWRVAYEMEGHFNAEQLLEAAKKVVPEVSLATVYRALPELVRSKTLREVDVGHNDKHYVSAKNAGCFTAQILCENCSKVIDFDASFLKNAGANFVDGTGFQFVSQHFQIVARCPHKNCRFCLPKIGDEEPPPDAPCLKKSVSVHVPAAKS